LSSKIITPDGAGKMFSDALRGRALAKKRDELINALARRSTVTTTEPWAITAFWTLLQNLVTVTGVVVMLFPPDALKAIEQNCVLNDAIGPGPMAVFLYVAYRHRVGQAAPPKHFPTIPGWMYDLIDAVLIAAADDKDRADPGHDE